MSFRAHHISYLMNSRRIFLLTLDCIQFRTSRTDNRIHGTLPPLTPRRRVFLEKLIVPHLVKRLLAFMNTKFHYRVNKNPSRVLCLSQVKPSDYILKDFLKIHFNIILRYKLTCYKWSLSLTSIHQNPVCTSPLSLTFHMPRQFILLDMSTWIISGEKCRSLSSLFIIVQYLINSSLIGPNIVLGILFSNIASVCSSLNMGDQFLHLY